MSHLTYCLPQIVTDLAGSAHPDLVRFLPFFDLYGKWVLPVDRIGTMKIPLNVAPLFPVPSNTPLKKTYAELCDDRAVEILTRAETLSADLHVLYSGGIDSTCLLVSLLKHASAAQKKHITVLLSHESIIENPRFYEEHLRGKLRTGPSAAYPELLGEALIVSAEHNDMLMGSDKIGKLMTIYGPEIIHRKFDRDLMIDFLGMTIEGRLLTEHYMALFERIVAAAPVTISTNLEFLWWINFAFKWHACFYYMLLFTPQKRANLVTPEYIDERFISFYNTEDFQRWSMQNTDKRIKDTWKSYKWIVKDIIYDFTKDAEYRDNKTKRGSLLPLIGFRPPQVAIDESGRFHAQLDLSPYLSSDNDFTPAHVIHSNI